MRHLGLPLLLGFAIAVSTPSGGSAYAEPTPCVRCLTKCQAALVECSSAADKEKDVAAINAKRAACGATFRSCEHACHDGRTCRKKS